MRIVVAVLAVVAFAAPARAADAQLAERVRAEFLFSWRA